MPSVNRPYIHAEMPRVSRVRIARSACGTNETVVKVAAKARLVGPIIQQTAARAYKAGVKIAFGTDAAVYPHGQNAKEFQYMVEAGIPPMYALQAATTHAAELLRRSKDLGSVEAGKLADVIAVDGNPLQDITLMQQVSFVMKDGTVYKQAGKATQP